MNERRVRSSLPFAADHEPDPVHRLLAQSSVDERMPWDHFDVGVKKAGLLREWDRAQESPVPVGAA